MVTKQLLLLAIFSTIFFIAKPATSQWVPMNGLFGGECTSLIECGGVTFCNFGSSNGIFRSTDGGLKWSLANRNIPYGSVWGMVTDGTHVFLGIDRIYMWSDDSMAWVSSTPLGSEYVDPLGTFGNMLYACTGPIYRSKDEGLSWTKIDSGFSNSIEPILFIAVDSFIFIEGVNNLGDTGELFRSSDSGNYWTEVNPGPNPFWCFTTIGKDLFAGSSQGISRSTDYGFTWNLCNKSLPEQTIRFIAVLGSSIVVNDSQGVYVSNDSGASWQMQSQKYFESNISAMTFAGDTLIVGTDIGNYLSLDTGRTWIASNNVISVEANGLFVQDSTMFAGDFYRSTDSGMNWSFPITNVSSDSGYYLGNNSLVSFGRNIYAASTGVFVSTDNGVTWTSKSNGLPQSTINCVAVKGSKIFAGSEYDGMFVSTDSGSSWVAANNGLPSNPMVMALCVAGNFLIAGLDAGLDPGIGGMNCIFFSSDDGLSWVSHSDGLSPNFPECNLLFVIDDTTIFAEEDESLYRLNIHDTSWTPLLFGASSFAKIDSIIFIGSNRIFESFDYGDNWIRIDSGITDPDILSLMVFDSMLFAGTSPSSYNYPSAPTIWRRSLSELMQNPYILAVKGTENDTIDFGQVPVGTTSLRTATPYNVGVEPLTIQPVSQPGNEFRTSDLSGSEILDTGESFTFEVYFQPTDTGYHSAMLSFISEAKKVNLFLTGTGIIQSDVENGHTSNAILSCSPNPISQSTTISFTSQSSGFADISIHNLLGTEVAHLYSGELAAGSRTFSWEPSALPDGIYECVVRMNSTVQTLPILLQHQ